MITLNGKYNHPKGLEFKTTFSSNAASDWSPQENLARLQRAFARKWEFIFMQAEAQVK